MFRKLRLTKQNANGLEVENTAALTDDLLIKVKTEIAQLNRAVKIIESNFHEVSVGMKEISNASEAIAQGAASQAEDAEKTYDLTKNVSENIANLAEAGSRLSEKASRARENAHMGNQHVDQLKESEINTKRLIEDFNISISQLDHMAGEIRNILMTITNIANQTNLLSLNAAIEAARAGDSGKGFAVVADQIGKLASQSKAASKEIETIISQVSGKITEVTQIASLVREDSKNRETTTYQVTDSFEKIQNSFDEFVKEEESLQNEIVEIDRFKDKVLDAMADVASITEESAAVTQEMTSQIMYQENLQETALNSLNDMKVIKGHLEDLLSGYQVSSMALERPRIGITLLLKNSEFMDAIEAAALKEAEKMDIDLIVKTPNQFDEVEQRKAFQELIDLKPHGIALFPAASQPFIPLIDNAANHGIPVVTIDADVTGSKRLANIGVDHYKMGETAGEAAAKHLKQGGRIIILLSACSLATIQKRCEGFKKSVSKHHNIAISEILEMQSADMLEIEHNLAGLLNRHKDANLLYVVTEESSMVAAKLFKKMGIIMKLVCISNSKVLMEYTKEGIVNSQFVMRNELWGTLLVRRLHEVFIGKEIPEYEDTGCYEVNQSNAKVFLK